MKKANAFSNIIKFNSIFIYDLENLNIQTYKYLNIYIYNIYIIQYNIYIIYIYIYDTYHFFLSIHANNLKNNIKQPPTSYKYKACLSWGLPDIKKCHTILFPY